MTREGDLRSTYETVARRAADVAGIDRERFVRQITQESGWAEDVIRCQRNSSAGAQGIAQIVARFHPNVNPCDPEAALDYAAKLMAVYLARYNGDWALALSCYNAGSGATAGGLAGTLPGWPYAETVNYVSSILGISQDEAKLRLMGFAPSTPKKVAYDPNLPAIAQDDDWSCAPTSARWAMRALGRNPAESWMEPTMLAEGVVSKDLGLLDASGKGLAAFIERHYGEDGYRALAVSGVTFDYVATIAGTYPILIGGRAWNHWSAVRMYAPSTDKLLLANPADGWKGVRQEMTRQQFAALGPFSAVRIWHPDVWTPDGVGNGPASGGDEDTILGLRVAVAHLCDVVVPKAAEGTRLREEALSEAKRVREEFVGPKP